jgi:hypothetical protein
MNRPRAECAGPPGRTTENGCRSASDPPNTLGSVVKAVEGRYVFVGEGCDLSKWGGPQRLAGVSPRTTFEISRAILTVRGAASRFDSMAMTTFRVGRR